MKYKMNLEGQNKRLDKILLTQEGAWQSEPEVNAGALMKKENHGDSETKLKTEPSDTHQINKSQARERKSNKKEMKF